MGNRSFPFNACIRLDLVAKEFNFVAHGFVEVVDIRCMMGQFCRTFHGKDVCRARSLQGVTKALVRIVRTMSRISADDSVKSLLFLDNAHAIDKYKWKSRWKTKLAPLARCASFPVSFWASDNLKQRRLRCQLELSRLRTSWSYLAGIAMVSLLVSMMSPNVVCFGPITSSNHLSIARGHCLTATSSLPITTNIASIVAARTIFI